MAAFSLAPPPPPRQPAPTGETVFDLLARHAVQRPGAAALAAPGGRPTTYAGLARLLGCGDRLLASHRVAACTRVCVAMPQGPDAIAAMLSVMGRATLLPLSPGLKRPEYVTRFRALRPDLLLVQAGAPGEAAVAAASQGLPVLEWSGLHAAAPEQVGCRLPHPAPGTVAVVLPTSGTTGEPRRVPLTHANLLASARDIGTALALTPDDRFLDVAALHHVAGLGLVLASLSAGSFVFCAPGFRNAELVAWMHECRPTWMWLAPTMIGEVLRRDPDGVRAAARLGPLRLVRAGAMPLPGSLLAAAERTFGVPVLESYGMTEAAPQITSSPLPPRQRKPGSAGIAAGPRIRIARADGTTAAAGEPGEILVNGPNVMGGYEDDPAATVAAFEDGWFRTGDVGHLDDEGYLFVSGRQKEIVKCGGETISPREVEEVLLAHPAVADAVAFPVPDDRLLQVVGAAIVPTQGMRLDEGMLRRFLAARLTGHKVPVRILGVEAIPRTAGGKVARATMAATLGLTAAAGPAQTAAVQYVAPDSPLERTLADLWSRLLDCDRVGVHDSFFALGGDSFGMAELLAEAERQFGADGPALEAAFCEEPTIAALARVIQHADGAPVRATPGRGVIEVRHRGTPGPDEQPPLFAIPLAGGNGYYLVPLATRIAAARVFYILDAEELARDDEPSVERLAARCAEAIRRLHPAGPYLLSGHCFGGIVAYECARQLRAAGSHVTLLALLDTPMPGFPDPVRDFLLFVRAAVFYLSRATGRGGSLRATASAVAALARHARRLVQGRIERSVPVLGTPDSTRMLWRYRPGHYDGPVVQLIARDHDQTGTPLDRRMGWRRLVGGPFDVSSIGGTHFTVFDEHHVGAVAEFLAGSIATRLALEGHRPAGQRPGPARREPYGPLPGDAA